LALVGRKTIMIFGEVVCLLTMVVLGLSILFKESSPILSYVSVASVCIFIIGFALSLGPVPWIIMSEIFPTDARGVASSIATGANWLSNLIVVLLFPTIKDKVGANSFFIFAGGMVLFILFTILVVYETKNKTIEELTKDI
jgi:MFS family permease